MARYLDLSSDIAGRVVAGELAPGADLPSVRVLARERSTNPATVARAYHHLAEAGVLEVEDRRRARVARGGPIAARHLLDGARTFRLAGSDDPALDVLLRHAGGPIARIGTHGSFQGLVALWRGEADGATIHVRHRSGSYNEPFARALLRDRGGAALIHLWRREQGLLVPAGNPRGIAGPPDLRGLRLAQRGPGTGTRVLLDRLLSDAGIDPDAVAGPGAASHLEVALAVASGLADAGLGIRSAARALDLEFVVVAWEPYELALSVDALGAAAPLVTALRDPAVRERIRGLGGYDLAAAGDVAMLG